jgi:hypothetical protein
MGKTYYMGKKSMYMQYAYVTKLNDEIIIQFVAAKSVTEMPPDKRASVPIQVQVRK